MQKLKWQKKLVEQLVMEAQKQLDMDEELARKLQEEIYGDDYGGGGGYQAPKPTFYSPYGSHHKPATPPVAKGPTVKAPSIKQLIAESQSGNFVPKIFTKCQNPKIKSLKVSSVSCVTRDSRNT